MDNTLTKEDILEIKSDLQQSLNIKPGHITYRVSKSTDSCYLRIRYNRQKYDIRFSDHTYSQPADTDKILLNCRYKENGMFIIEASIFKYNSDYISKIIRKIDRAVKFFSNPK